MRAIGFKAFGDPCALELAELGFHHLSALWFYSIG
jgi:hypothetical protein